MKHFRAWCIKKLENSISAEVLGAEFQTSPEHIHAVYMYFFENCSPNQLKEFFLNIPAIFVPDVWKEFACSGKFFYLKEVCWNDPTGMFRRYKQLVREEGTVQEPHLLAPFYSQWDDLKPLFMQQLNVDKIPTMKQYVELLELICEKTPLISMDILKDVSVIYAVLAEKCKIRGELECEVDENYCSTLRGMLKDKPVFPTKDSRWVSLEKKPLISDNKHLEKIFKSHDLCLLQLSPVDPSSRQKLPFKKGERETQAQFREEDRALFLEICGIQKLSSCIRFEAQTENYRPCPVLQNFVRSIVPFIQRFLYHHEGFGATYDELKEMDIKETLTKLSFGQVGKLYIQYQMDFNKTTVYEQEDVVCHLRENKEFYIQKDHINSRTDVCRETVKLFSLGNADLGKELDHFLQGLLPVMEDKAALQRFLNQEDIRELPETEDKWEVPLAIIHEPKVVQLEEHAVRVQENKEALGSAEKSGDGEKSLASWPPKSSFGGGMAKPSSSATENVMRMWPPPAPPSESRSEAGLSDSYGIFGTSAGRSEPGMFSSTSSGRGEASTFNTTARNEPSMHGTPSGRSESGIPVYQDQSSRGMPSMPPLHSGTHETPSSRRLGPSSVGPPEYQQHPYLDQTSASQQMPPTGNEGVHLPPLQGHGSAQDGGMHRHKRESEDQVTGRLNTPSEVETEAAATCKHNLVFQGNADTSRPPLALDYPIWTRKGVHENVLEELDLHSSVEKPVNNEFVDNELESDAVGEWGEHLVYAFLMHWKERGSHPKPLDIVWSNREGLSGMPYDFKVVFPTEEGNTVEIFIEVKATVKAEKHFVTLSANEVDFALKVKEQYHLYRVYNAGDSKNVRLCRIKNLAQCLHSKQLTMYLFI
ncbi:uncharacterized protein LOC122799218 [Protopterus annectens]|uniref:uncharacterized protein LOC122799218 n=1 Tax=Protopterus annectens TaxID=7888 RepID=UPI001CFC1A2F|nr:uncharacterized protein LOC122799218 [Protopterus annectens]